MNMTSKPVLLMADVVRHRLIDHIRMSSTVGNSKLVTINTAGLSSDQVRDVTRRLTYSACVNFVKVTGPVFDASIARKIFLYGGK